MTDPTGGGPNQELPNSPAPVQPAAEAPAPAAQTYAPPAAPAQAAAPAPAQAAAPAPAPAAASAPPPAQAGGNWQTRPPAGPSQPTFQAPSQFQPVAAEAGPAPGILYADLTTRIFAFIIDAILLSIAMAFVGIALGALFVGVLLGGGFFLAVVFALMIAVVSLVLSAGYFIWGWTNPMMRASLGQKLLGLQTVSAADGATLTRPQAIRRWAFLYGFVAVASALQSALGSTSLSNLTPLISLVTLGYVIYLLWTTSQSAKRQGFHDVQAGTVVVKPIR